MRCNSLIIYKKEREKLYYRFYNKIFPVTESGCWLWVGALRKDNGYPVISFRQKCFNANRISYALHKNKISAGLFVCHKCDIPECVNPDHLWLGTHRDNMNDMIRKNRHAKHVLHNGSFKSGNEHLFNKITVIQREEIKVLYKGGTPQKVIAKKFKVTQSCISRIVNNTINPKKRTNSCAAQLAIKS